MRASMIKDRDRKNAMLKLLLFLCVAGLLAAQNAPPADSGLQKTDGAADPVIRETFKFVLAPVTVTDRDGSFGA